MHAMNVLAYSAWAVSYKRKMIMKSTTRVNVVRLLLLLSPNKLDRLSLANISALQCATVLGAPLLVVTASLDQAKPAWQEGPSLFY